MIGGETIEERFYSGNTVKYNNQVKYNETMSQYNFRVYVDKPDGEIMAYNISIQGKIKLEESEELVESYPSHKLFSSKVFNSKVIGEKTFPSDKEIDEKQKTIPPDEEFMELYKLAKKHFEENPFKPKCFECNEDMVKPAHCCIQTYRNVDKNDIHPSGEMYLNNLELENYICEGCAKKYDIIIHSTDEEILFGIAKLYLKEYLK